MLKAAQNWLRLRKRTVIAHWLYGMLCGVASVLFFPAGIVLLFLFASWEKWNDQGEKLRQGKKYKPEGDLDFWDSLLIYAAIVGIALVLHIIQILAIRWW